MCALIYFTFERRKGCLTAHVRCKRPFLTQNFVSCSNRAHFVNKWCLIYKKPCRLVKFSTLWEKYIFIHALLPPANKVWGKVMVLHLSVILSTCIQVTWAWGICLRRGVCLQGGSASRESASRGSVSRGSLHPWGGVGQIPPQRYMGYYRIQSTSERYPSYWNAFLFIAVKWVFTKVF